MPLTHISTLSIYFHPRKECIPIAISAAALAKAAAGLLTTEKGRKGIGWLLLIVFSPLIFAVILLLGFLQGGQQHNISTANYVFAGTPIQHETPPEFTAYIDDMRSSFLLLDDAIDAVNQQIEDGELLNSLRVKSIFYTLYFGTPTPSRAAHRTFVDCFATYEERTREVEVVVLDEDGEAVMEDGEPLTEILEEHYTVAVPIRSLQTVYANLHSALGISASFEQKTNAQELYYQMAFGGNPPTYGEEFDDWINSILLSDEPFVGLDGFTAPVGGNWRELVSSEFGWRTDPLDGTRSLHGGIDLAAAIGTPIYASLDGTVVLVRYSSEGYGYHVLIDHGGSFVTLYAHCSELYVTEGQSVQAGDTIAAMGDTGRVTGPHLHYEIREGGQKVNPRSFLP